ncbi:MAG: GNAT family N-acetyltransferase [Deltaproteobacteria bacterium]|nr:GNAT family N-acetyltransferase [Deltaproteobacteria bacterium]
MHIRGITKADFDEIVSVMDQWWGGPSGLRPEPYFFYEFGHHALVAEEEGALAGFLLGFVSDREPRTAYVHLVGISPNHRRRGIARGLYEEFARRGSALGATTLKAITTVGNEGSVEFHRAMRFEVEHSPDYAGPSRARYVFTRALSD